MVVLPPGALVREGVQRDAPRKAKLKTGTQLLAMGDEEVLGDGTRRTRVTWSMADESCVGWVSSKNCAPLVRRPRPHFSESASMAVEAEPPCIFCRHAVLFDALPPRWTFSTARPPRRAGAPRRGPTRSCWQVALQ